MIYVYIYISKSTAIAAVAALVQGAHGIWYTNVTFTTLITVFKVSLYSNGLILSNETNGLSGCWLDSDD